MSRTPQRDAPSGNEPTGAVDDVGVADARNEARFVEKHAYEGRIAREPLVKTFHRNGACEASRADLRREVDRCHAAGCDLAGENVPPAYR
jgi:hypothetical protein